jgi:hypothetical protein
MYLGHPRLRLPPRLESLDGVASGVGTAQSRPAQGPHSHPGEGSERSVLDRAPEALPKAEGPVPRYQEREHRGCS